MKEKACGGGFVAQMCAVAVGHAHICNCLDLLGEFLSYAASHILCPAESTTQDNELLDCLLLFFLSYLSCVSRAVFPTDRQTGWSGREGEIKESSLPVNIQYEAQT